VREGRVLAVRYSSFVLLFVLCCVLCVCVRVLALRLPFAQRRAAGR
jgi:hypothetical protein